MYIQYIYAVDPFFKHRFKVHFKGIYKNRFVVIFLPNILPPNLQKDFPLKIHLFFIELKHKMMFEKIKSLYVMRNEHTNIIFGYSVQKVSKK